MSTAIVNSINIYVCYSQSKLAKLQLNFKILLFLNITIFFDSTIMHHPILIQQQQGKKQCTGPPLTCSQKVCTMNLQRLNTQPIELIRDHPFKAQVNFYDF